MRLVLDLASVPAIDRCGLGAMIEGHISAPPPRRGLKLLNVSGHNVHLLAVTKLVTLFEMFDSEEEAARSFAAFGRRRTGDTRTVESAAKV
jgi:anti-sigma B factor antagonist